AESSPNSTLERAKIVADLGMLSSFIHACKADGRSELPYLKKKEANRGLSDKDIVSGHEAGLLEAYINFSKSHFSSGYYEGRVRGILIDLKEESDQALVKAQSLNEVQQNKIIR